VDDFPSLKARRLLAILMREPLNYRVVRRTGSHRTLRAPGVRGSSSLRTTATPFRLVSCHGWWAESPDIDRWTAAARSYDEVRQLAEEGVRFALERDDVIVEHLVPASA
jgi:hypothetical protein